MAVTTGLTEHLVETRPHPLACHLDQAKLRHLQDLGACPIVPQGVFECLEDALLMFVRVHIDKIDDHQATDIPQAELADGLRHGFEIGG